MNFVCCKIFVQATAAQKYYNVHSFWFLFDSFNGFFGKFVRTFVSERIICSSFCTVRTDVKLIFFPIMILSNPNRQADNGHYLRTIITASIIQQTLYIVIFFSKLLHNKNITMYVHNFKFSFNSFNGFFGNLYVRTYVFQQIICYFFVRTNLEHANYGH